MRTHQRLRTGASLAAFAIATLAAGGAVAQQDQPTSVDDVIVTANKREQSLQDVPSVVTAISEQLLTDAGVKDIRTCRS
ncbi:hypothetical protein ACO2Q1_01190 [Brevundimonas sp. VNH65]|uniref:hypothetical protein n=1 Tax=Brevundimonas sp. VNH65 TaxID=3400917 RepID=UPI003C0F4EDC